MESDSDYFMLTQSFFSDEMYCDSYVLNTSFNEGIDSDFEKYLSTIDEDLLRSVNNAEPNVVPTSRKVEEQTVQKTTGSVSFQAQVSSSLLESCHDEINNFIEENKAKATKSKTRTDLNQWYRWCETVGEKRKMEDIPPQELDVLLCHYFMKAKKLSGEEYEPDTLKSHLGSFDRYLHGKGKQYNLIGSPMFRKCNEVLAKKRRQLRTVYGKGRKPNKAESLTDLEIDKLWRDGQLGDHSPRALLNTMWFFFTTHYG